MQEAMKPRKIDLRPLVVLLALVVLFVLVVLLLRLRAAEQVAAPTYWPTTSWQSSTPEAQGLDSVKLAEGLLAMREQGIDIHSLLLVRNGSVVVDAYFYPYDGSTVHDLASETKSIMTTLIGIAADQGKLSLDAPMLSFFPDRTIANRDARKERITVRHLTSMSSGFDCTRAANEPLTQEMLAAPDAVQFALDRRMASEPGTQFAYCNMGSHLLSAILQQATGMTALDFARQNLFEPLGIRDVMWPTDPHGVNRGWGDLHLHPRDMAKIGYLWLNKGRWEDKQVVSREWVENSVTAQIRSDGDDNYGYGWWLTTDGAPGEFRADGRGGQYTIVLPTMNLIVETTGGGFEGDEIGPLLGPAVVDMQKPLPANPAGVARLNAALTAIAQPPAAQPVAPLPETARAISGKTIVLEPNPMQMETMRLDFNDSAEALWQITLAGRPAPLTGPVGLDGVYRLSPGDYGLPGGARGAWADAHTFVFEYDEIASIDVYTFRLRFEQSRVVIDVQSRGDGVGFSVTGRLQSS
ncbi:MAG: serine hydrolase [Ardenticatenaceae bacterium]|nr:serine hydrolase [Ardenticatenaceae bacterium]